MKLLMIVILVALIITILMQHHRLRQILQSARFFSYYSKHLKALADHREIVSRRTELLMMSVGYDPNRIADGDLSQHVPTSEEMKTILEEHYKLDSESKQIDARLKAELEMFADGEFDNYGPTVEHYND
ncbi:hypothetical protein [Leuconostoc mesenteroides]|uniref:hypothetical protein n=1 Tax=Leuconostoc mesenteroides TaxID=1245 RepID=UPI00123B223B|nr:hypothetical protein [Leuconostoc mesenteroides]KAA8347285.1 hypothetical protein FE418_07300 [Leuconostoc mesenteroides]